MPNNLFLFTGDETFLLNEQVKGWRKAFLEKHGDINLVVIDGKESGVGEVMAQVEAAPFLGDKRLIFIEGLPEAPKTRNKDKVTKKDEAREEELKKLSEALDSIPETSVVVFVQSNPDKRKSLYKKIVQQSQVKQFDRLEGPKLNQWVQQFAVKSGAQIDYQTTEYLIAQSGQDLWKLSQEVKKLSAYCDNRPVTKEDINHLVTPSIEANIFHLTDALGAKDSRKAIQNLHKTIQAGENLNPVFYMIVRQFRLFLSIKSYTSKFPSSTPQSIATTLKLHPFVVRNTVGQLRRFNENELKSAYEKLLAIDVALKTGGIRMTVDDQEELALAIEKFILEFCS